MAEKKFLTIHITKEWCKGCGMCVHFCPAKALTMHEFKAAAENPEKCSGCMMCEMRCPDFAIEVKQHE